MSKPIEAAFATSDRQLKQQMTQALTRHQVGSLRGIEVSMIDELRLLRPEAFRDSLGLRRVAAAGIALLAVLLVTGCSKSQPPRPAVHLVSGKVTFDGRPAAGAQVVFHPKNAAAAIPRLRSHGRAAPDRHQERRTGVGAEHASATVRLSEDDARRGERHGRNQ
jgi:hypothetical protein